MPILAAADTDFRSRLETRLPPTAFPALADRHVADVRGHARGRGLVVAPGSTEEVAALLSACHEARVGVVPVAGATGLVQGHILGDGPEPVLLSAERLGRIRSLDPVAGTMIAEAGVILADAQSAARDAGRLLPLSLASEGSARIGGLLATNAGGTAVIRYGNARALCLGVEAVTAEGRVWHGLSGLVKDNAGYDLRDLLIGSEGTLAVITAATLRIVHPPAGVATALLAVPSPQAALDLLALAQGNWGEAVQAFELIGRAAWDLLAETRLGACPLDPVPDWAVLVELGLPHGVDPAAAMEALYLAGDDAGFVTGGTLAQTGAQAAQLWVLRERIPEANRTIGAVSSHDISLPRGAIPGFLPEAEAAVHAIGPLRVNAFGHLGDGNLHWNVFPPRGEAPGPWRPLAPQVAEAVYDRVAALGGSVAAEHGVGRTKVALLERHADPVKLAMMRAVKEALDPRGILNPGAVLARS